MLTLQKILRLVLLTGCIFALAVSYTQAEEKNQTPTAPDMNAMMGMMNPAMYMNMMNPMMGMMNPAMGMNMMNPMMGMMNPMMGMNMMGPMMGMGAPMMGSMMNPMMGMNMMYPMMGMMGPMSGMMNPMSGMGMMPNMGSTNNSNPMGQMMDPKQYEQWFSQWTEMMKNMTPQTTTK